ncbi:MAG: tRNA preQ1(34) S-adenosylmethionine ribosyltransferase-isomerase QueA [Gaiellales bacterium]
MLTSDLDYHLPPELIAQEPAEPRHDARLLVYDRASGAVRHRRFAELGEELRDDDLLVVNDTRVLPVRLRARRESGGAAEVLLLEPLGEGRWEALVRPYRRLRAGETVRAGELAIVIEQRLGEGRVLVRPEAPGALGAALEQVGEMPLPPYITRHPSDPERYQTVYAEHPGSAAAPTAGLHFSPELWEDIGRRHQIARVTLGVGLDTFRPIAVDELERHPIHTEPYRVPAESAELIRRTLASGSRVVAVGTTSVRVLETVFGDPPGPLSGRTGLFITPGFRFRATGAMITNFHLPRSSLLSLVMAFAGVEQTRSLYRTAVDERYRFYSFGDASLIL